MTVIGNLIGRPDVPNRGLGFARTFIDEYMALLVFSLKSG